MAKKKIIYSEPVDYFPESIRKELKLGEYAPKDEQPTETATKKASNYKGPIKEFKSLSFPEGTQSVNVDDIPQEYVDAYEKHLEGMAQEEARRYASNFGDPSVDYSKVDFSNPEE